MTPPTLRTRNSRVMLDRFCELLSAAGYVTRTGEDRATAVAAVLADARLYCRMRHLGWDRVCDLVEEQHGCDLGELAHMDTNEIDLRRHLALWEDGSAVQKRM